MADDRMKTLRDVLGKMGPQLAAALPRHIPQERFLRVMLTTVQRNRRLLECSVTSILGAMMEAAQAGLELDGTHAALVPYNEHGEMRAHFMAMYRGLIAMARRSGEVSTVRARAVYTEDVFVYEDGLSPILRHVRGENEDEAAITHFYAIIEFKDGGKQFEVMTRRQVDGIRDSSPGYRLKPDDSPWRSDYPEMGCKTVARRALKWAPASAEVQRTITRDELSERGQAPALEAGWDMPLLPEATAPSPTPEAKAADLAAQVRAKTAAGKRGRTIITKPGPGHTAGPVAPPAEEPPPEDIPPPGDDQGVIPGL